MDDNDDPEALAKRLVRLRTKADWLKEQASDAVEKAGYIQSATNQFADAFGMISTSGRSDPLWPQFLASGQNIAGALEEELDIYQREIQPLRFRLDSAVQMFSNAASTGVVACNSMVPGGPTLRYQPFPFESGASEQEYVAKLTALDPSLGETYRAAWANQYNQQYDPGRTALAQMRQTFDHLFGLLAPDPAVKASPFWNANNKPPHRAENVDREERQTFAADKWISDKNKRTVLLESAATTAVAYQDLNRIHKRGSLDEDKARETFLAIDAILRRWIDSIEPWPPKV